MRRSLPTVFLLFLALGTRLHAQDYEYTVIEGTSIKIDRYVGEDSEIVVPETLEGLPVTEIGNRAFYALNEVTSISLSASVTSILPRSIQYCYALTEVTVDAGNSALSSLDGVLFDKARTVLIHYPLGRVADSYVVPEGVTHIGDYAFSEARGLAEITLPESLTHLGILAFSSCSGLTSIDLPGNLAEIGRAAFASCTRLTTVNLPASVVSIGSLIFENCTALANINVAAANPSYSSVEGVLLDKDQTTLIQCPGGKAGDYFVPESVTTILRYAFFNCDFLTSIWTGSALTHIEEWAFQRCDALSSVTIGGNLSELARHAFSDCPALTEVYFGGDLPSVEDEPQLFTNTPRVTVYILPESSGWSATLGERPTAPWLPTMHTDDGEFGIHGGSFGFNVSWAEDREVVVEGSTSLKSPDLWNPLGVLTISRGRARFADPEWIDYPARFYRLRTPD